MEKISIIVPVYNVNEYLEQCIQSLINQTYEYLEIILVDDGSTDGSGNTCDYYAERDNRIKVIHKENGGLVTARKAGLQIAEGKFIGFVDGDDWIENKMYEKLVNYMIINDADIVASGMIREYVDRLKYESNCMPEGKYVIKDNRDEFLINVMNYNKGGMEGIFPGIWSKLFKKDVIIKGYDMVPEAVQYGEDRVGVYASMIYADNIYVLKECLYHYRIRNNSMIQTKDDLFLDKINMWYTCIKNIFTINNCCKEVFEALNSVLVRELITGINKNLNSNDTRFLKYQFPTNNIKYGAKIILYGAGRVGKDFYNQILEDSNYTLCGWVDKNNVKYKKEGYDVESIDILQITKYDYILIGIIDEEMVDEIKRNLINTGVQENKIIWLKPQFVFNDF